MAGILNNTARQFNLKVMADKGRRVKVFLKPGLNIVDDAIWKICSSDAYIKQLKKDGLIDFGTKKLEEAEMESMGDKHAHAKVNEVQVSVKKEETKD